MRGKSGIYKIVNAVNGKVYVGSASCLGGRRVAHFLRLRKGNHHSVKLQRAWEKYGEAAFSFEVLEWVEDKSLLLAREQHWIDAMAAAAMGYNICAIAGRSDGQRWSDERRAAHSALLKGRPFSLEHRASLSRALMGHEVPAETRAKIGEANRKALANPESRAKISRANSGRRASDEAREKMSVAQLGAWTPERRKEVADRMRNYQHSPEAKAKIAANNSQRVVSDETRKKMSRVIKAKHERNVADAAFAMCAGMG